MNLRCSCGAVLVDGALFCHLCGKPQRDDLLELERQANLRSVTPAPVPNTPTLTEDTSAFNAHRATRAAVLAAVPGFFLFFVAGILLGGASVLVLIPAGFLSVRLYQRASRELAAADLPLTAWAGARLGWMTGLFTFVLTLIPIALAALFNESSLRQVLKQQIEQQAVSARDMEFLNSTAGVAAIIGTGVLFLFVAFTVLAALGGALCAQMQVKPGEKNLT